MKILSILVSWAVATAIGGIAAWVIYTNFGTMWALIWLGGVAGAIQWSQNHHERGHRG